MTYSKDEETLWACNSEEEKICVKEGTKRIGPYAFNCTSAQEIILPDSLVEKENICFYQVSSGNEGT